VTKDFLPVGTKVVYDLHTAMRSLLAVLLVLFGSAGMSAAQTCTGLCQQQVTCPAGQTTSITGTIYAPNGVDPLPDVLVFIPNAPVAPFTPGVSCPVVGQAPSGSPLVGATTAVDGTFELTNVPVGTNIPLVIQTGRWRRQLVVSTTTACANTLFSARMPKNQSEGDIPFFAVSTGSSDQVECVLRKVGIDDAEFTAPGGGGRINLFASDGSPGAVIAGSTADATQLMGGTSPAINTYDVLMLPCEGGNYTKPADQLANLVSFANAGGRVYSSHFSFSWMIDNPPFNGVVNWINPPPAKTTTLPDGLATVDQSFYEGATLAKWLQITGASTTPGQIAISTLRHDFNGVVAPTQSWLTLNDASASNPVMQFVFNAPVGQTQNQCGRVLFNEYHVEDPVTSPKGIIFPNECPGGLMNAQEKLLEYSLFELTADGNAATLTPASADFGAQPIGFPSAAQTFTWTNNSTFPASVTLLNTSGDFTVAGNNCSAVAAGASCTISVIFTPAALGARTGVLTVGSSGTTLTSTLTGIGTPDFVLSTSSLNFSNDDLGKPVVENLTLTNVAAGTIPLSIPGASGDFAVASNCGSSLAAGASCILAITFTPTATGPRTGSMTVSFSGASYAGITVAFAGNGVDFSIADSPASGNVIAGYGSSTVTTTSPIAGFASPIYMSCTTNAPAATCTVGGSAGFIPQSPVNVDVSFTTTSKYTVVGYGGAGGSWLWLLAVGSGVLLWLGRRRAAVALRTGLLLILLAAITLASGGCSGKLPALNPAYTPAGNYTFTISATDGFLVHSTTYAMTVTTK
jgi:hypothetical protein